jgi:DNA-directed RNA polymerase subunit E'/Rpb7
MKLVKTVRVPSCSLTRDLKTNIFTLLKNLEGTCTKKSGYIIKICSLDRIIKAYVNTADCSNSFIVECTIEAFYPEINVSYIAKILAVYPEGLIVEIKDCVTAFITTDASVEASSFVGSEIDVKLEEIIYVSGQFRCVGTRE